MSRLSNSYWLCCYPRGPGTGQESPSTSTDSSGAGSEEGSGALSFASALLALASLVIVAVAVSTGQWLLTEEKLPRLLAGQRQANGSNEPQVKFTYSGLWRVCVAHGRNMEYECSSIDYFPKEEYSPDPSDSTMAIPYAVTKSAFFFITATALLVIAEVCYFAGQLSRPRPSLMVFVAGVVFIISGLLMLVGMVMYISVFKAEVGSKLRPRSSFQGPPFVYRYGYSFLLYVSGFITTEFAGTTAVFLHISWQQLELAREFSKRKYPSTSDAYHLDSNSHNHHHQHHLHPHHNHHSHLGHVQCQSASPHPGGLYGGYLCERHQKRYFYEAEPIGCHHHHSHPGLDYEEYLPPGTPGVDCGHYHHGMTHDLTTETVSTIADVLQDEYGLGMQHEFVTFDLGENLPPLPETVRNSAWKSNSFKKTTPV